MKTNRAQFKEWRSSRRKTLPVVLLALMALPLLFETGCQEFWSQFPGPLGGPLVQPPDHSHDLYYGTGTVMRVDGNQVFIDFGSYDQPKYWGMTLLIIRDNRLVGKIKGTGPTGTGRPLLPMGAELLEGTAAVGDMVIGVQHEHKYKKAY